MSSIYRKSFACTCVVAMMAAGMLLSGCYTRLTTSKETREYRVTYPEIMNNEIVMLQNAIAHRENTFIMSGQVYMETVTRFRQREGGEAIAVDAFKFRAGSLIEIDLPGHPEDPLNGTYTVRPEGTIDVGHIENFQVAGRTADEIRRDLKQRLKKTHESYPIPGGLPSVSVNIPTTEEFLTETRVNLGKVYLFNSVSISAGGGVIGLSGNDTLLSVMAEAGSYTSSSDWNEVTIFRRIHTKRIDPQTRRPIEYYLLIVVDLEQILYDNPNMNIDMQDGDLIHLHAEKAPLIVEIFNTARMIIGAHGDLQGLEAVLEDIFKRNF